jgi:hypothetical protein
VHLEFRDRLELQGTQVLQVLQVLLVEQVLREGLEQLEHQDLKVELE